MVPRVGGGWQAPPLQALSKKPVVITFPQNRNQWVTLGIAEASSEGFLGGSVVKNPPANAGDCGCNPWVGKTPQRSNPLQYSCLGNPMDRGAWQATVHGVTKELDMT